MLETKGFEPLFSISKTDVLPIRLYLITFLKQLNVLKKSFNLRIQNKKNLKNNVQIFNKQALFTIGLFIARKNHSEVFYTSINKFTY